MQYLKNKDTGKEYEIVYFKHNNDQILTEHVNDTMARGNYEIIIKEDNI